MAVLRTTRRLLRAVGTHYANRRRDASLRDCDPRMLKDVGLRWERGTLVPVNPERFANMPHAKATDDKSRPSSADSALIDGLCPHCGGRLT
ncbi:hypothetical protein ACOJCM_10605 [Billgrantia sp. LNSP4103-1]|uniref:hypothetical protein n=1 Tax=Billgrantia sp. LNSP4103-1 TaxID=3410266 RepID=UPI00403FAC70